MRFVLLFLPLPLLAQFDLCPWTPWTGSGSQWQGYIEHSGYGSGWNAAGLRWHSESLSLHACASARGQPFEGALGHLALNSRLRLSIGWGLEQQIPYFYSQWNTTLSTYQKGQLQLRLAEGDIGLSATYWEHLESGWLFGISALYSPSTGILYIVQADPPGLEGRARLFVSTSGDWRVTWNSTHASVSFGVSAWPWLRSSLHWGKAIASSTVPGMPTS